MPGIHPASRQQVRWAFAAESRGQFPKGKANEWAHNWKCWTKVPLPPGCSGAMRVLDDVRRQHPTWKVPGPVLEAEALRKKVIRLPERARPAAKVATVGVVHIPIMRVKHRPATIPIAAYTARATKSKKAAPKMAFWGLDKKGKPLSKKRAASSLKRQAKSVDVLAGPLARVYAVAHEAIRSTGKKKSRRAA